MEISDKILVVEGRGHILVVVLLLGLRVDKLLLRKVWHLLVACFTSFVGFHLLKLL